MKTLEEVQREHITAVWEACGGQTMKAAKILGMGKTTMYRRLKKYGIRLEWAPRCKSVPIVHRPYLWLPRTQAEVETAHLRCPSCRALVMLPEAA
jgi:Bacterial regulatory protein, Fis family